MMYYFGWQGKSVCKKKKEKKIEKNQEKEKKIEKEKRKTYGLPSRFILCLFYVFVIFDLVA